MLVSKRVLKVLALIGAVTATPYIPLERRAISQSLMNDLERYVQFASGAYQLFCPAPLGTTLVKSVSFYILGGVNHKQCL